MDRQRAETWRRTGSAARAQLAVILWVGLGSGFATGAVDPALDPVPGLNATIHVDQTSGAGPGDGSSEHPYTTIRSGMAAAMDGDVVLVAPGTYVESLDFEGKAITVRSALGPGLTIVDGNAFGAVVSFVAGEGRDSVLDGFTIQNGLSSDGGGVRCLYTSPTIINNVVRDNVAAGSGHASGGGIFGYEASPLIADNVIEGNVCPGAGGGINLSHGQGVVSGNIVRRNTSGKRGGGIRIRQGQVPVVHNVVYDNSSAYGGGINCAGSLVIGNVVFGNRASVFGGGVYSSAGNPRLIHNTIFDNTADEGGGGVCIGADAEAFLANSIVWNNTASVGEQVWLGALTGTDSSLNIWHTTVQGGLPGIQVEADNTLVWGSGNLESDPLLTGDQGRLSLASPCLDAADPGALPLDHLDLDADGDVLEPQPFDRDGRRRLVDGDENGSLLVDMGAYELQVCQTDLGYGGPGEMRLAVCGEGLSTPGAGATLSLWGAAPFAPIFLVLGTSVQPTPFAGGDLVPFPYVVFTGHLVADGAGVLHVEVVGGLTGIPAVVIQAVAPNGTSVDISNALSAAF